MYGPLCQSGEMEDGVVKRKGNLDPLLPCISERKFHPAREMPLEFSCVAVETISSCPGGIWAGWGLNPCAKDCS